MEHQIGIHIDIPPDLTQQIISAQQKIGITHPSGDFDPHITLYYTRFSEDKFDNLYQQLTREPFQKFELTIGQIDSSEVKITDGVFHFLELKETTKLHQLHRKILEIANPLRGDLLRAKDVERKTEGKLLQKELDYLDIYGSFRVLDNFNPHITLGVCKGTDNEKQQLHSKLRDAFSFLEGKSFAIDYMVVGLFIYDNQTNSFVKEVDKRNIKFK